MELRRRQFLQFAGFAVATPAASRIANAQTYPTRPITIMVGGAAGGPTDTIARNLTPHLRASLGQPIIIENNGAAAGSIAHGRTARAPPDGYTLSLGLNMTHVTNGAIYNLSYDVVTDFEPVSLISTVPALFVARSTLPANDLDAFFRWLKVNSLTIRLHPLANTSSDLAVRHLCAELNTTETLFPGTELRLIYDLVSPKNL